MLQGALDFLSRTHTATARLKLCGLPINKPQCPCTLKIATARCASTRAITAAQSPNYEPNSFWRAERNPQYRERPKEVAGTVDRHNQPARQRLNYNAAGQSLPLEWPPTPKQRLIGNIVASMSSASRVPSQEAANPAAFNKPIHLRHGVSQRSGLQIEQIVNQKQQTARHAAD